MTTRDRSNPAAIVETHSRDARHTVVVVGNGAVGQRFCELATADAASPLRVVSCDAQRAIESDRARSREDSAPRHVARTEVPGANAGRDITHHHGERVERIDVVRRRVVSSTGREVAYDTLVLATGASTFVPPISGTDRAGVFVVRSVDDLNAILVADRGAERVAVLGGGSLGLQAAKAARQRGLETHLVEEASRLLPRRLEDAGSRRLQTMAEQLGIRVHLDKLARAIAGDAEKPGAVTRIDFASGDSLEVDLVIVVARLRPRDELARQVGVEVHERGGVQVDDRLETSAPDVFAIGECAVHRGVSHDRVDVGYEMARVAYAQILDATGLAPSLSAPPLFDGADSLAERMLHEADMARFEHRARVAARDPADGASASRVPGEDRPRRLAMCAWPGAQRSADAMGSEVSDDHHVTGAAE